MPPSALCITFASFATCSTRATTWDGWREMTLKIARTLWNEVTSELHRRTEGRHESGVFLLGERTESERRALAQIYYDELDPCAYDTGICVLHGDAFAKLWSRCSELGLTVVADAHVHLF